MILEAQSSSQSAEFASLASGTVLDAPQGILEEGDDNEEAAQCREPGSQPPEVCVDEIFHLARVLADLLERRIGVGC